MNQIDMVVPDGSMQETITSLLAKAGLSVVIEKVPSLPVFCEYFPICFPSNSKNTFTSLFG